MTISTRDLKSSPGFQFLQFLCTVLLQTFVVWKTCVLMAPVFILREMLEHGSLFKSDKSTLKVIRVSFQGFCEVSTTKMIKGVCFDQQNSKQN